MSLPAVLDGWTGVRAAVRPMGMNKLLTVLAALTLSACGGFSPASLLGGGGGAASVPLSTDGPDKRTVPMGTVLPFGEIAINCEASGGALGVQVDANAGYTLYDSNPNTTGLRPHYLTGFKDRCARQFSAATALMGDVGTHEVVRYLPSNAKTPYSVTDDGYEAIKASFCGARRGSPCGGKIDRLAKNTTFVTAYKNFGENPTWEDILLHAGQVVAISPETR